jgi:hypothetical protein
MMLPFALLLLLLPQSGSGVQTPPAEQALQGLAAEWAAFRTDWGNASNEFNLKLSKASHVEGTVLTRKWCDEGPPRIARARELLARAQGDPLEPEIARWITNQQADLLVKEERLGYDALQQRLEEAQPGEVPALRAEWRKGESRIFADVLALVGTIPLPTHERELDFAVHLLTWILQRGEDLPEAQAAFELLPKRRASDRELADLCSILANRSGAHVTRWLTAFSAEPFEAATRGNALYALALQDANAASMARHLRAKDETAVRLRKLLDPVVIASFEALEPEAFDARAIERLELVGAKYSEALNFRGKLGVLASARLHELRDLAVGKQAPEIAGKDVDGLAFKLSDYRGKVVLLDFWGYW